MSLEFELLAKAAVLGLVEGATEFIPVSSTGHLILAQRWLMFTGSEENAFVIFIQLGAILAVVWLYREKFLHVARNWRRDESARRLIINMIVGTIPAVVIGLPTEDWIETHLFKPFPVSVALVLGGVAMLMIDRGGRRSSVNAIDDLPVRTALGVGAFQVLAILFPGLSRSGATILGGLVLGLSRRAATEFSFFLAIPAMFGATLVKMLDVHQEIGPSELPMFAVGFGVAFVSALVVIRGLVAFVSHSSFAPFAWYRILFGSAILLVYSDDLLEFSLATLLEAGGEGA